MPNSLWCSCEARCQRTTEVDATNVAPSDAATRCRERVGPNGGMHRSGQGSFLGVETRSGCASAFDSIPIRALRGPIAATDISTGSSMASPSWHSRMRLGIGSVPLKRCGDDTAIRAMRESLRQGETARIHRCRGFPAAQALGVWPDSEVHSIALMRPQIRRRSRLPDPNDSPWVVPLASPESNCGMSQIMTAGFVLLH